MNCPRCQYENVSNAAFCDQCGARLDMACPNCGEPNRRTARFCRNCGQSINRTSTLAPTSTAATPAPETYLPKHLAEKILASRRSLEGERKQVTVLFADIRGSTSLLEGLDPEEGQKIIDPVLHIMMDAVHRFEGTVNQVLGDGIMALFGAPLAHEDHALRACYTALAMQAEMRRHRRRFGQSEESGLQIGIGMNSGEVVVRSIDNDLNMEYSALGHATNLAARMEELAGPGAIILTATTLRDVEGFVEVKPLGAVQAKGVTRAVEAYELTGATSARTRVQATAARGLTPFVGRRSEVEVFNKLVEQTAARRGQILAMVGEPGMGKSRLVHEFTRHQLPSDWLVLEGASVSYGKATPYFPLIEMLHRYFQIANGERSENIQERVVTHVLELDNMLKDTIAPILSLLGASPDENDSPTSGEYGWLAQCQDLVDMVKRFNAMEPQQRRRRTLDAVKRVLIRESQRQPLLVVFEDLHWIDSETQAFLDSLIESLPMTRILLLVDYRPEYSHSWGDKTYYTQLRVDPLPRASAEELLQHLLGQNRDLAPLKQLLIQRTEGNPFFAEESVRSLVETGVLLGEKGTYRPGLKINEIHIPSTVQNVVADRIDRLSVEAKQLLQTAAAIGVIVPLQLLSSVAELSDDDFYRNVASLQSGEFLYESKLFPELEYTFKHALTNEVAYGALLHDRKISLHAKIVSAIEQMAGDNPQDEIENLARHAFQAELWDKAAIYLKAAGTKAAARSSFRNAVFCFEQALEALRHLPESRDALMNAVDLRIEIRNAYFILGDFHRGLEFLDEARRVATVLNDPGRLGTVFNLITAHYQVQGNSEQAISSAEQALNHTKSPEHLGLHVVAHYFLGIAYHNVGKYEQAITVLQHALTLIGERKFELFGTTGIVSVVVRAWLIRCLAQMGRFQEALSYADDALQIAMQGNHAYSIVYVHYALGVLALIKGDFERAIETLERGLELCKTADIPVHRPLVSSCLGSAYAFIGRFDEALKLLGTTVEDAAWIGRMGGQALRMVWVSIAYMLAGELKSAETLAHRGLDLSQQTKDLGSQAWLQWVLGEIKARRGLSADDDPRSCYESALQISQELRMRPLQAHCWLSLSHLKRGALSGTELKTAIDLYRELSMPFWLARAEVLSSDVRA